MSYRVRAPLRILMNVTYYIMGEQRVWGGTSRLKQGSVFSPTLFNIHIDDLERCVPKELEVSTYKYANDCTQSERIMKGECSNMQEVLHSV